MPSFAGCLSSSLGIKWMERPASFTVGTMVSLPFMGSERELGPRGGELSLFICLASLLRYPSWESRWRGIPEIIRICILFYFKVSRTKFWFVNFRQKRGEKKRNIQGCQEKQEKIGLCHLSWTSRGSESSFIHHNIWVIWDKMVIWIYCYHIDKYERQHKSTPGSRGVLANWHNLFFDVNLKKNKSQTKIHFFLSWNSAEYRLIKVKHTCNAFRKNTQCKQRWQITLNSIILQADNVHIQFKNILYCNIQYLLIYIYTYL